MATENPALDQLSKWFVSHRNHSECLAELADFHNSLPVGSPNRRVVARMISDHFTIARVVSPHFQDLEPKPTPTGAHTHISPDLPKATDWKEVSNFLEGYTPPRPQKYSLTNPPMRVGQ